MLYKYRTIENFRYFVEIILKSRLFAAPFFDLNDPMEGRYVYSYGHPPETMIRAIKGEKEKLRIVSLSRNPENILMWSHYANGHRGIVIGLEVDRSKYDVRRVKYSDNPFSLINPGLQSLEDAKQILSEKHSVWSYEEEERIFVENRQFANVMVREIVLGSKMSVRNQGFVRDLICQIGPNITVKQSNMERLE